MYIPPNHKEIVSPPMANWMSILDLSTGYANGWYLLERIFVAKRILGVHDATIPLVENALNFTCIYKTRSCGYRPRTRWKEIRCVCMVEAPLSNRLLYRGGCKRCSSIFDCQCAKITLPKKWWGDRFRSTVSWVSTGDGGNDEFGDSKVYPPQN